VAAFVQEGTAYLVEEVSRNVIVRRCISQREIFVKATCEIHFVFTDLI